MQYSLRILAYCCLAALVAADEEDDGLPSEPKTADDYIRKAIDAEDLIDQQEALSGLFSLLTTDAIADLKSHPHDTIAMAAAWHEVLETIPERTKPETLPHGGGSFEQVALERFLGFAEGRLRTRLPKVWQESLRQTKVYAPGQIHLSKFDYWPQYKTQAGWFASLSVHASSGDDGLMIDVDGEQFDLPSEIVPKNELKDNSIAAAMNDTVCVLGFPSSVGLSYELKCYRRTDHTEIWNQRVLNAFGGAIASGMGHQSRSLVRIKDDRVLVLGTCLVGSYVELFDLETGKPHCRFSTTIDNQRRMLP